MGALSNSAYEKESRKIIRRLLQAGIDPTIKDKKGNTAEQLARERGFTARADLIKKLGK